MRILVVDDDAGIRRTLSDIFRVVGHEVALAQSGQEALESLETWDADCVLTDVRMPGMSGVDLSRLVSERHPGLPVVVMTAYAASGRVDSAVRRFATASVSKPLELDHLLALLEEVCPPKRDHDRSDANRA